MAPVPPASADAELIALAAGFRTVDARLMAINEEINADTTGTMSMDKGEPAAVHDRWWAIVDKVIDLPAFTVPGWVAKGGIYPAVLRDTVWEDSTTADHRLPLSLVRDLTGQVGPGPDVDLLAACEAFAAAEAEVKASRGESEEDEAALSRALDRWYATLDAAVAIPARTAAGHGRSCARPTRPCGTR